MRAERTCLDPGTVSPEELLAWSDGEAGASVRAHIDRCPACRAQAMEYQETSRFLAMRLQRADCPATQTLADYAVDLLSPGERTAVAAHLVSCGRCTVELAALRDDLTVAAVPEADRVPLMERLATFIATLVPAVPQRGLAATRGEASAGPGPDTYAIGDVQIALNLSTAGGGALTVRGLVLSLADDAQALARSRVDVLRDDTIVATAELDEFGHFILSDLSAGIYRVQVSFPDRAVVIPSLPLTGPS